ncbi:MAG: prevent-host-death protein [Gemmatimonadetes bacterium]|nr:prevent-host-death protein [Gemmatimonadota bacterium]
MATRELRNRPGAFQDLVDGQDVVLTSSGKPFALVIGIDGENVEETVRLVSRVRAEQALSRLRKRAAEQGLDRLTEEEVEKEVRAARRARRRRG